MRICQDCNKPYEKGYTNQCRSCYRKQYHLRNKEALCTKATDYYNSHKETVLEKSKIRYEENREKYLQKQEVYRINNLVIVNQKKILDTQRRRLAHVETRIKENLRGRVYKALKGLTKAQSTMELVGCSVDTLKQYLSERFQDGMSWNNYGQWHIDHIRPCALFDLTDPVQQKKCFHFSNLQPLWAVENFRKGMRVA